MVSALALFNLLNQRRTLLIVVIFRIVDVFFVVVAQQLFSYRRLFRLKKSATMVGLSDKSCSVH